MADSSSRTFDNVEKIISFSDDLMKVLQDPRDLNDLSQTLQHPIFGTCHSDLKQVRSFLQEHQNKIESYNQKIEEARSETAADAELDLLQRELDEELEKERLLKDEFRALSHEFNDLEQQQISFQEQRKKLQKIEQEKLRTESLLSMYASVTNILPNSNDESKISGYIVEKDKNAVDTFEYDTSKMTTFDVCNEIWKTVSD